MRTNPQRRAISEMLVAHLDGQSAMFPAITSLRQFLSSRLIFLLKNNFYVREVD